MSASTHDMKYSILTTIEGLGGEARLIQIAHALGPEWVSGSKFAKLRKMMRRMVDQHVLVTHRRGVYSIHPTFGRRGLDGRDHTVRQIEAFLIERCGAAKTSDIHKAVGARDISEGVRDAEHKRVTEALANTSDKFCQDYGPGVWTLKEDIRKRLPLLGWWAQMDLATGARDHFFAKVGEAFSDARDAVTVDDVVANDCIGKALRDMANAASDAKHQCLATLRKDVARELAAKGITDEYSVTLHCQDRIESELLSYVYREFEAGDSRLHLVATPEFYRKTAALFGVDPARLSRGEVGAVASLTSGHRDFWSSTPPVVG